MGQPERATHFDDFVCYNPTAVPSQSAWRLPALPKGEPREPRALPAKLQFTALLHEVQKAKKRAIWQEQEYFQIIYKFKILLNRCQILCPDGKLFDGSKKGKKKKWNIFITENNEILQNIVSFKRNIACWIFHKNQEFFPFLPEQPGKDPIAKFKKICIM